MATSDSKDGFWDRMRESEPDVLKAYLWCRLIPHLHEEYPCTNTKTGQHPKTHYTKSGYSSIRISSRELATHIISKKIFITNPKLFKGFKRVMPG